jgi:hypothetical protein
MTRARNRRI